MAETIPEYSTGEGVVVDRKEVLRALGAHIQVRLPLPQDRELRLHAAERRVSRRRLILDIIGEWLSGHPKYAE